TTVAEEVTGNFFPFPFTVPAVSTDKAFIRAYSNIDTLASDTTDAPFTILNPTMSVLSPTEGEIRVAGVSGTIEWESQDVETVVIEYSTDGGALWNHIATGSIQSQLYNWTTPPFPTDSALVRVSDDAGPVSDESGMFTILVRNLWTGAASDDWADTSNWSEGEIPDLLDYVVVPPTANDPVVRDPVTNVFVGGLTIESEATLRVESQVDTFKTSDDVLINGTLEALGEPEFVVGGDWYNDPLAAGDRGYVPGLSTVRFSGRGVLTGAFYNLEVDSGAFMTTSGSVTVSGTLTLAKSSMEMNPQDTLTIFSDDTLSVTGDGLIICGTIVRALMTGTGAVYRYESPKTTVRFPDGNEPDWYAMSTMFEDPDSILMWLNAKPIANAAKPTELTWIVVPEAILDTAAQTFTIEDAEENGIWTFGFIDSSAGKPRPDEILAGTRFMRRTYRGSSGRNIPKPDTTTTGPTYTFRWDKADMPAAADSTEDDWSELRCFTLGEPVGSDDDDVAEIPTRFALEQNYPNPFNPTTTIRYALPEATTVRLEIYNALGERVATLVNGAQEAGYHKRVFAATRFASGVYFYRLEATSATGTTYRDTKKMLLVK
ncbi:MAG: T9SS type A sorting domain-containing protein, partial [Ignavibacteriales bacterium]|nr:T9SS type A sorting domain-containing protein [Ignavibacteriales bacterium]